MEQTVAISFELANSQYKRLLQLAEIENCTLDQIAIRAIKNYINKEG